MPALSLMGRCRPWAIAAILGGWAWAPPGAAAGADLKWGDWATWGDQGDGTYRNPVLPADFSDLDCIRVDADYYAISSTFQFSPGMVVLHSRDLVNWSIRGHVVTDLTQISPELNWDRMNRYGRGVWAGAIRFHAHRFWVYFGTPDEGYFMSSAPSAAGPWEPLTRILAEAGWDDCCPFWDDDGQGYLVGTNFRDGYKVHLWKLSPDGRSIRRASDRIIHQSRGSEANKLYKIDGRYYHVFSEVRAEGRVVMAERAAAVGGPYTEVRQLNHAQKNFREPNQGGLVQTAAGGWFWFTHHGTGDWAGRIASLLPVTWIGGWPVIGQPGPDGIGTMVWTGVVPVTGGGQRAIQSSDDFSGSELAPQWEWNYQPRAEKWSLTERSGWLRLHAFRPLRPDDLLAAGNTLTQRSFQARINTATAKLDLRGMADGQVAGLCHFSKGYSLLGVRQDHGIRQLELRSVGKVLYGPAVRVPWVWLRSTWGEEGLSQYAYSFDGVHFTLWGEPYPLVWSYYRGDRIGLFCWNTLREAGYVDVDFFDYEHSAQRGAGYEGELPAQRK